MNHRKSNLKSLRRGILEVKVIKSAGINNLEWVLEKIEEK